MNLNCYLSQVSYGIGLPEPLSVTVFDYGTGTKPTGVNFISITLIVTHRGKYYDRLSDKFLARSSPIIGGYFPEEKFPPQPKYGEANSGSKTVRGQ